MIRVFPAGKYYIGDVSLALSPHNQSLSNTMGCHVVKTDEGNSFEYIVASTGRGNGIYKSDDGQVFIVAKNNIGMIPIYLLDEDKLDDEDSDIHNGLYEFKSVVTFKWLHGVFTIKSSDYELNINTNLRWYL
jgi:hypothetical protein